MTDEEREPESPRRRPVGGAAAWRLDPERPIRAAWDDQPEKTRYARESVGEQLAGGVRGLVHNRAAMTILTVVVGGLAVLAVLTPAVLRFDALVPFDCVYIRAGDPDQARPIGPAAAVRERLLVQGAERAMCNLAHSHEVAALVPHSGLEWPGEAAVAALGEQGCQDAFRETTAGRTGGPDLALTVVDPDRIHWAAGIRRSVCLVHRADGQFLTEPALLP